MPNLAIPPALQSLPADVYFRYEDFGPDTYSPPHAHSFGQLHFVSHGVMNLEVAGERFLSPPHYAVWVPPGWEHSSYNAAATTFRSAYISERCSTRLPAKPCSLTITPILRAILIDFSVRDIRVPETEQDQRLALVLLDQLWAARPHDAYLPDASSAELKAILEALRADPSSDRSIAAWAAQFHLTARTLERRCQQELGITLGEWRHRMRLLYAIAWLDEGRPVQRISFDLGYGAPSAFIAMFRRFAGMTPEQYRLRG
jgi:AraC-like DNA-binding protein